MNIFPLRQFLSGLIANLTLKFAAQKKTLSKQKSMQFPCLAPFLKIAVPHVRVIVADKKDTVNF